MGDLWFSRVLGWHLAEEEQDMQLGFRVWGLGFRGIHGEQQYMLV